MINKVVISAAGRGTRMGNLTDERPKHLLEISGHPFIYYLLSRLEQAGFSEMILVVGYKKELYRDFLKKYPYNLKIIDQYESEGDNYGTAIPIKAVREIVGRENFVAVAGDNLYSVRDLRKSQIDDKYNYVSGLKVSQPQGFGLLEVDHRGFLKAIIEKPQKYNSDLINCSLYKFTPDIFEAVDRISLSPRGEYEITESVNYLANKEKVKVIELEDFWLDFGRPGDIEKLAQHLKEQE